MVRTRERKSVRVLLLIAISLFSLINDSIAQKTIAREWNEVLLEAIRNDFARPTVHARNLFHISSAMYDSWAVFDSRVNTYLLGNNINGFSSSFDEFSYSGDLQENREKAISHAAYTLLIHRFNNSPGFEETETLANNLMASLGLDRTFTSQDYSSGSSAALGNYIAAQYIAYGSMDGSNEANDYVNRHYEPVNDHLRLEDEAGNPRITHPNRWQPLALSEHIDQAEFEIDGAPEFLSPEWGEVWSFSLSADDQTSFNRDEYNYITYHDPGPPPYLGSEGIDDPYKWGFALVSVWSGQLDPTIDVDIDISPASIGNMDIDEMPTSFADYDEFYDLLDGGDASAGHSVNPATGQPYQEQLVPLGDYGRVLAEFWADGPDSETPPGHWFTLLNWVNDHPDLEKRLNGLGPEISNLDWDIITYFTLGGTMHDAAISAWGIKGKYDYVRPVSAIRYMADQGQSSDDELPSYDPDGIPLIDGYIELVDEGDDLAGEENANVGKIKLKAWRGPDYIDDEETEYAGVDWILAEQWWPYQRPSFVTPPFAGYVSGHSTYSRAAAEVLTLLTGDEFFPGGMGTFPAAKNEFLVFEDGPSVDLTLQWATYRDASDQCSLSRIWGGIHPPADDIPGRRIGEQVGIDAFAFARTYYDGILLSTNSQLETNKGIYPNPSKTHVNIFTPQSFDSYQVRIYSLIGSLVYETKMDGAGQLQIATSVLDKGSYILRVKGASWESSYRLIKE